MKEQQRQYRDDDEITLKELILKVREFWFELWRNWWLIALICIPFIGYYIYKTLSTPPIYGTEIRFIVEGQNGGGISGLGGLLGSFGLGRSSGGGINPFKITEVAKSQRLAKKVLFTRNKEQTFLANKILDIYDFEEKWKDTAPELVGYRFESDSIPESDINGRSVLLSVFGKTIGNKKRTNDPLLAINFNEDSGIFSLGIASQEEQLSLNLLRRYYAEIKYFFEEQILKDKSQTRDVLKEKSDSISGLINYRTIELARFEDANRGLVFREAQIKKSKIITEIQGLTVAYGESIKNFEIADYSLKNSKPLFLKIDETLSPVKPLKQSLLVNLIIGGFLGCFVGSLFVILRSIYRSAMLS